MNFCVFFFVSVPQHFLVGGECQSSFDTFWWKLFLPGTPIIDSWKMHSQEKQHISEMIIKRKRVESLKFSLVTSVTEFSDYELSGKRIFYLKSDFSMERIEVRSLKSCFDWVLFLLTWTTTSLATILINFRLFWNENPTQQLMDSHAYVCSCPPVQDSSMWHCHSFTDWVSQWVSDLLISATSKSSAELL